MKRKGKKDDDGEENEKEEEEKGNETSHSGLIYTYRLWSSMAKILRICD